MSDNAKDKMLGVVVTLCTGAVTYVFYAWATSVITKADYNVLTKDVNLIKRAICYSHGDTCHILEVPNEFK